MTGGTDWQEIALLYEGLVQIAPRIGSSSDALLRSHKLAIQPPDSPHLIPFHRTVSSITNHIGLRADIFCTCLTKIAKHVIAGIEPPV